MEGIVTFYEDQPEWIHAYNDDAIVISNIIGYKLYVRFNGKNAIGFPQEYLRKVTNALKYYNIGYCFNDDGVTIEYSNSKYKNCLDSEFVKKHHVFNNIIPYKKKNKITGSFTIQFNDEEPITKIIGESISQKAPIVDFLVDKEIGNSYKYGNDIIKVISNNLQLDNLSQ